MNTKQLNEFCRLGETADTLLRGGRTREALKAYGEIIARLEAGGDIDSYLMAKVTLGVLRCHVKLGDFKSACRVWNSSIDDSLHGIGIYALENAQTTVRDLITYDMICAFLHTLIEADKNDAAHAVNQYLSRVCEQAIEDGDRALMHLAISNWKQHLFSIFNSTIPHDFAQPLIDVEKKFGEPVKPQTLDFPLPTPWEKPSDFAEMSRVVNLKDSAKTVKKRVG